MIEETIKIRNIELKNRIVMPPMATAKAKDGVVGEDLVEYYEQRSKHLGMIVTEHAYVCEDGLAHKGQMGMIQENKEMFTLLTQRIHNNNCRVIAQISHAGIRAAIDYPIGPSDFDYFKKHESIHAMTLEDMERVKQAFVDAALLAKECNFDGVEIHIAHSYLLNQFYSPLTNHREDQYGGSVENRIRYACEIVQAVRESCGNDFVIGARLGSIDDKIEGGNTKEDAIQACIYLEKAGADLLSISGGLSGYLRKEYEGLAYYELEARAIKEKVSIPVLLVGGITSKDIAEKILHNQSCDLIGVGRPLLKDPDYITHF